MPGGLDSHGTATRPLHWLNADRYLVDAQEVIGFRPSWLLLNDICEALKALSRSHRSVRTGKIH